MKHRDFLPRTAWRKVRGAALTGALVLGAPLAPVEAAAQTSGAAFQQRQPIVCSQNPTNCRAQFTVVPASRRMEIDFVSCFLQTAAAIDPNKAAFLGINDALSAQFRHTLIWEERQTSGFNLIIISQPISLIVVEGKRADIAIPFPGSAAGSGDCAISGRLVVVP